MKKKLTITLVLILFMIPIILLSGCGNQNINYLNIVTLTVESSEGYENLTFYSSYVYEIVKLEIYDYKTEDFKADVTENFKNDVNRYTHVYTHYEISKDKETNKINLIIDNRIPYKTDDITLKYDNDSYYNYIPYSEGYECFVYFKAELRLIKEFHPTITTDENNTYTTVVGSTASYLDSNDLIKYEPKLDAYFQQSFSVKQDKIISILKY